MFNNRMLAVAAVLAMAVPALGAATPIVVPPVPEQLVEGHTVFTVIEIVAVTATNETRFAAAVAVLVREYSAAQNAQRFPGVLWFNDQYLVNPYQNARDHAAFRYPCGGAVMAVNAGDPDPRVVIADVTVRPTTVTGVGTLPGVRATAGDDAHTYNSPPFVKPTPGTYTYNNDYAWIGADVGPTTVDPANPPPTTQATVWSDTVVGSTLGGLDGALFNASPPWDYRESYLITDPNDHSWIIDKYEFYTRDSVSTAGGVDSQNVDNLFTKEFSSVPATATYQPSEHYPEAFGGLLRTQYAYPVWVVNMLGSPVFLPDYGVAVRSGSQFIGENCLPYKDLIEGLTAPLNGALCGVAVEDGNLLGTDNDTDITLNAYNGVPPWTDNPCMSYEEPSRNGYCYGGQTDIGTGCPHGSPGNDRKHSKRGVPNEPFRQYNALLYFKLEDLRVWDGSVKDHCNFDPTIDSDPSTPGIEGGCNPAGSSDTNGCSEEQYPWGPNPPQAAYDWPCGDQHSDGVDSDGDGFDTECGSPTGTRDDCEGNSHPFHPLAPPHNTAERCLPQFLTADPNGTDGRRRNQANHGGSSYITPSTRATDAGWYQVYAPCDYAHTTRNVDIYFSPAGRPFPPPVRNFDIVDLEGSSAPFQDFHLSYPGVS